MPENNRVYSNVLVQVEAAQLPAVGILRRPIFAGKQPQIEDPELPCLYYQVLDCKLPFCYQQQPRCTARNHLF